MGDVDGDGKLDLIAAYLTGLDWWRNSAGDGSAFTRISAGTLAVGSGLAAADFDLDGDLDVVTTTNITGNKLRFYDNLNGLGTSWNLNDVANGQAGACSPVAADFDGDGWPDVAAALLDAGEVRIYRNDHSPATGLWPNSLAAADDRAAAAGRWPTSTSTPIPTCCWPPATSCAGSSGWPARRSPSPTASVASATQARALAAGDFDRDGDLDLAYAAAGDDDLVYLPNQNGRRTYLARAQQDVEAVDGARSVATGDLDNDGDLDLAVSGYASNQVRWEESTAGRLGAPTSCPAGSTEPSRWRSPISTATAIST